MTSKPKKTAKQGKATGQSQLRAEAESKLTHSPRAETSDLPAEKILHELSVHQVELEAQNEELRRAYFDMEVCRDRYLDLYEFAPIGYLTLSHDGLISEINLTGAAYFQVERRNLIRRHFSSYVSPDDRDQWHQVFSHALHHSENQYCELKLLRGDGSHFHAQLDNIHPLKEGDQPTVHLTISDFTRHFQALASERRLGLILDNTQDMIFIFDPDSLHFVYANKGAIHSIGYSKEELLTMTPSDVLQTATEQESRSFIAPLASGRKKVRRFETLLRRKNGMEFPVEVQLQLIRGHDDPGLYVAVVRDITRRKIAERTLRRQKNLMWQVIDSDPNMIVVKDEHGKILLANQALADRYDLPIQALIGKKIRDLKNDIEAAEIVEASDREVIETMRESISTQSMNINGKNSWFNLFKRPLLQDDGSVHLLGIAVDVSALKEAADKLADSYKELQQLVLYQENVREEERAEIARNLHDEMGATLAALKMRIAWLASKLPPDESKLIAETGYISDLVSDGIKTMRQVVSDLRPNLLEDVGLLEAVRDYAKRFEHNTDIQCTVVHPEQNCPISADQSTTVFRIIQESLNNVAKHSRGSKVVIEFSMKDSFLLLQITDNGIGFDPSEKVRTYGLLGIKERALMIGGEAWVTSAPGHGTKISFRMFLPDDPQIQIKY